MELPSPDDVRAILTSPFVVMYWPLIVGLAVLLAARKAGQGWTTIPIAVLTLAGQAWKLGMFGGGPPAQ